MSIFQTISAKMYDNQDTSAEDVSENGDNVNVDVSSPEEEIIDVEIE